MANTRCCVQPALTLERTPSGWIQRASFTHPDLHDELVEEIVPLSSPFSSVCARGSSAFTFLLLGDQNAGKSTFLHSFSHAGDATWLEIVSYLPIISASFVNASLCTDSATPPMDEPPFLDTDIGTPVGTPLTTHHSLFATQHTTHESRRTTHNSRLTTHDS